jgi:hypothetical protein
MTQSCSIFIYVAREERVKSPEVRRKLLKSFTTKSVPPSKMQKQKQRTKEPVVVMKKLDLRNAERGIYNYNYKYIYI